MRGRRSRDFSVGLRCANFLELPPREASQRSVDSVNRHCLTERQGARVFVECCTAHRPKRALARMMDVCPLIHTICRPLPKWSDILVFVSSALTVWVEYESIHLNGPSFFRFAQEPT